MFLFFLFFLFFFFVRKIKTKSFQHVLLVTTNNLFFIKSLLCNGINYFYLNQCYTIIYIIKQYISHKRNSWLRFRVQKLGILDCEIQMSASHRVFIPSRASKYMLERKHKSFRKNICSKCRRIFGIFVFGFSFWCFSKSHFGNVLR